MPQNFTKSRLPRRAAISIALLFTAPTALATEVLIPSYFYPSGANNGWPQLNAAAGQVGITAILNPASGPGMSVDSNYTSAVNSLRAAGGRVIGYVSTSYAARSATLVKADILKYSTLYNVDGFFLDEMTNTGGAAELSYYADIYGYIKSLSPNFRVVGNPGTNTLADYLTTPTTDTAVTFENNTGYSTWSPAGWTAGFSTRRFSNLPYNIPDIAGMVTAVNAAANRRVGYVYVTDDSGANPWDRLPTYWADELSAIRAVTPTWNSAASGTWNQPSNWTNAQVPNGIGAEAVLLGAIAAPRTVFADTPITLGSLVLGNANRYVLTGAGSLTMDAAVESALIDVRRGSHTINLPLVLADSTTIFVQPGCALTIADPLTVNAGAALIKQGAGFLSITSTIDDGAALLVQSGTLQIEHTTQLRDLAITGGALEIGSASLSLSRFDARAIRESLRRGVESGGQLGIASDLADLHHRLAYSQRGDGGEIALALLGDANRDGSVNFDDLRAVARHFEMTDRVWVDGDFTYDGAVNQLDLALIQSNYVDDIHTGNFEGDWQLARSIAPEPALAVTCAVPFTSRRRRK